MLPKIIDTTDFSASNVPT